MKQCRMFFCLASTLLINMHIIAGAGSVDTSFGVDGFVITNISRTDLIYGCTVQPNDTIVAAGSVNGYFQNMGVARYLANGTLDTTFNSTGTERFLLGNATQANAVALQSDNKILLTGYTSDSLTTFSIVRLNTDGSFDTTFNDTGIIQAATGNGAEGYSILVQPDTNILAGGFTYSDQGYFTLLRYDATGNPDATFGTDGVVLTPINYLAQIAQLALQSDNKIIAAGHTYDYSFNPWFSLARYNTDGTLDEDFGDAGIVQTPIGAQSGINSVAIQDNGFIVVAGYTLDTDGVTKFALARYDTTGELDDTFGTAGVVITPIHFEAKANSVIVQDDGKIVAGGYSYNDLATEFAIVRYNTDGTLDESFGTDGITTTTIGGHNSISNITSLAFQSTGDIIAAGYSNNAFALTRYFAA